MENIIKKFTLEKIAFPLAVEFEVGIQNKEQYRYYVNNCVLRRRKFFFLKFQAVETLDAVHLNAWPFPPNWLDLNSGGYMYIVGTNKYTFQYICIQHTYMR